MARASALCLAALAFVPFPVSGSALPGILNGAKPALVGSRGTSGRYDVDAVKIDNGGVTLRPRGNKNTADVGSE